MQPNKPNNYDNFLARKLAESEQRRLERQKLERQMQEKKNREIGNYAFEDKIVNKEVLNDDVVTQGVIVRVKRSTMVPNQFRVECEYQGQRIEAIASREEVIQKNIGALLNFYEQKLGLRDQFSHDRR